jgi:hypothetical protein
MDTKLFKVDALPIVFFGNMHMECAIVKHFIARRTTILHRWHVPLLHVPLRTSSQSNRLSTDHADETVLTLLHLHLHQQL